MSETKESRPLWHTLSSESVAQQLAVDPAQGLSSTEVTQRRQQYGPNVLSEAAKEPLWLAFLKQYKDYMRIVLTVAAVASLLIGEFGTAILLFLITAGNAYMALRQEHKAEESVAALNKMMVATARVRRDGQTIEVPAEEIVPGDVVLFEAGDRVPADGRLLVAATLEIEESALTGESTPVLKDTASIERADAPLGDRLDMAYMNCSVTRGRGEMLTTATGMGTEVGHIAGMLQSVEDEKSPLTKQIDSLTLVIAAMAGVALILIIVIGLDYGASFHDLYLMGIALAIAAIPTGLPVVVTLILSMGATEMASHNAIIKRLPAVETLGSTSAICSDKTGTLTLNQMTASDLLIFGHQYSVTGQGYGSIGEIRHVGGAGGTNLDPILLPMVLCSDAVITDGELVGDPTEGALVVLAQKGGLMVGATRQEYPRMAEVPFDSAYKLMATFHNMVNADGDPVTRCYVKGAPDVLIARSASILGSGGSVEPLAGDAREKALDFNERLASQGKRVMVVAGRDLDPATFDPEADLLQEVNDLTLLGMVGIVDPSRPEAKSAIAESVSAGIRVRMITGDHAVTAAAIAGELGTDRRYRRDRPRSAGGQGPAGQDSEGKGKHCSHDGGWRERCARIKNGGHRSGHGHYGDRCIQRSGGHDPDRRQLCHHRERRPWRPHHLRQPAQIPSLSDGQPVRLYPGLSGSVGSGCYPYVVRAVTDPIRELGHSNAHWRRPGLRQPNAWPDET